MMTGPVGVPAIPMHDRKRQQQNAAAGMWWAAQGCAERGDILGAEKRMALSEVIRAQRP